MKTAFLTVVVLCSILMTLGPVFAEEHNGMGFKLQIPEGWHMAAERLELDSDKGETVLVSAVIIQPEERDKPLEYFVDAYMKGLNAGEQGKKIEKLKDGSSTVDGQTAHWVVVPIEGETGTVNVKMYIFKKGNLLHMFNYIPAAGAALSDDNPFESMIKSLKLR